MKTTKERRKEIREYYWRRDSINSEIAHDLLDDLDLAGAVRKNAENIRLRELLGRATQRLLALRQIQGWDRSHTESIILDKLLLDAGSLDRASAEAQLRLRLPQPAPKQGWVATVLSRIRGQK